MLDYFVVIVTDAAAAIIAADVDFVVMVSFVFLFFFYFFNFVFSFLFVVALRSLTFIAKKYCIESDVNNNALATTDLNRQNLYEENNTKPAIFKDAQY